MRVLVLGLYTEGPTDERFLPPLIRRTAEGVLAKYDGGDAWDDTLILPIRPTAKQQRQNGAQKLLSAATNACGCHMLIVHADADGPTPDRARAERFDPGLELVKQAGESVCQDLLPIIPVQEIEAWLLADKEILLKKLGANKDATVPNIPSLQRLEAMANPKEHLDRVIEAVNGLKGRITCSDLYEPLGEMVRLEKLEALPSYKAFLNDFISVLIKLKVIS
jgi:hypothetical protein